MIDRELVKRLGHLTAALAILCGPAMGQAPSTLKPKPADPALRRVVRVIDGDTIAVRMPDGGEEKCRLIGVDAPELSDRRPEVRAMAVRSARFLRELVDGKDVALSFERGSPARDRYGRLLVYVTAGKTDVNREIVARGFAATYSRVPFSRLEDFRRAERIAREKGLGLWATTADPGKPAPKSDAAQAGDEATVYITRTGKKYHNAGCRALGKSAIPVSLETAREHHEPCKLCHH